MVSAAGLLVVRSRVMPWGFLVALSLAAGFGWFGFQALALPNLLPARVGVFVEPPPALVGTVFLGFALFLCMIGVSEIVRYLSPSVEVVIDGDGIATFGLLGTRRARWSDIRWSLVGPDFISLTLARKGRVPSPDIRVHFSRLDRTPAEVLDAIRRYRPDLVPVPSTTPAVVSP